MNQLYPALVKKNNDINQEGKVQIYIEALMKDVNSTMLPWARPFYSGFGGSVDYGISSIPEENSFVWVFFEKEDLYRNPFYIADVDYGISSKHHTLFTDKIKSLLESNSSYPNTKYKYYKNGICIGVDSSESNPEIFMSHPKAKFIIKQDGELDIKLNTTKFTLNVDSSGVIDIKSNVNKFTMKITASGKLEIESDSDVSIKAKDFKFDFDKIELGNPAPGKVLTTLTDPVIDNITGAPSVGSTKVMAAS